MGKHQAEVWVDLPSTAYAGCYSVSDQGRVRSLKKKGSRSMLAGITLPSGYRCVTLYKEGKRTQIAVHRLVLMAFCGEPEDSLTVGRHLNGIRDDNRLENLAWGDRKSNAADRIVHTKQQGRSTAVRISDKAVVTIRQLVYATGGTIPLSIIADAFGVSEPYVGDLLKNKYRTLAGGPDCFAVPRWASLSQEARLYSKDEARAIVLSYRNRVTQPILPSAAEVDFIPIRGERWKPLQDEFAGLYKVSDRGRVMRLWSNPRSTLTRGHKDVSGYMKVNIRRAKGRTKSIGVHRLVLFAFVGKPGLGQECRHLNGIRDDNRLENLVWGDRKSNAADRKTHKTQPMGEQTGGARLTEVAVEKIKERVLELSGNIDVKETAAKFDVSTTCILQVVNGTTWPHVLVPGCVEARRNYLARQHDGRTKKKEEAAKKRQVRAAGKEARKLQREERKKNCKPRLDEASIIEIRHAVKTKGTSVCTKLASKFKVSRRSVVRAAIGITWPHVAGALTELQPLRDSPCGSINHTDALAIRAAYTADRNNTLIKLGEQYGVSASTINAVVLAKRAWTYLGEAVSKPSIVSMDMAQQIHDEYYCDAPAQEALCQKYSIDSVRVNNIVRRKDEFSDLIPPQGKRTSRYIERAEAEEIRKDNGASAANTNGVLAKLYGRSKGSIQAVVAGTGRYSYFGSKVVRPAGCPSKLAVSIEKAQSILDQYTATGCLQTTLAQQHSVSKNTINKIVNRLGCYSVLEAPS